MLRLLLCLLLGVLPLAACKRKPAATPVTEAPAGPPNPEADLKALNEAARAYVMGQLKDPGSLDDLVKEGFIKRLPAAPAGQKYILSPDKKSVQLVNQ